MTFLKILNKKFLKLIIDSPHSKIIVVYNSMFYDRTLSSLFSEKWFMIKTLYSTNDRKIILKIECVSREGNKSFFKPVIKERNRTSRNI